MTQPTKQQASTGAAQLVLALANSCTDGSFSFEQGVDAVIEKFTAIKTTLANGGCLEIEPAALIPLVGEVGGRFFAMADDSSGNYASVDIGALSVYIKSDDEGVTVDVFGKDSRTQDSITSTYALHQEGLSAICDAHDVEDIDEVVEWANGRYEKATPAEQAQLVIDYAMQRGAITKIAKVEVVASGQGKKGCGNCSTCSCH